MHLRGLHLNCHVPRLLAGHLKVGSTAMSVRKHGLFIFNSKCGGCVSPRSVCGPCTAPMPGSIAFDLGLGFWLRGRGRGRRGGGSSSGNLRTSTYNVQRLSKCATCQ